MGRFYAFCGPFVSALVFGGRGVLEGFSVFLRNLARVSATNLSEGLYRSVADRFPTTSISSFPVSSQENSTVSFFTSSVPSKENCSSCRNCSPCTQSICDADLHGDDLSCNPLCCRAYTYRTLHIPE